MTSNGSVEIGIKQVLRYRWMQAAARMAAAGMREGEMRAALHAALQAEDEAAGRVRSAQTRAFAVQNLVQIWGVADSGSAPLRADALALLSDAPASAMAAAMAAHWAMISAAYPFWMETATQVGRLLNLQGAATQAQIVQRLRERYGDRPTVGRYARYVIRAMVDWAVLCDTARKGVYERAAVRPVDAAAGALLIEALRRSPSGSPSMAAPTHHPALYPFDVAV